MRKLQTSNTSRSGRIIIVIDGVAASGKGELAAFLAKYYNCDFLPTGNLYRVATKKIMGKGVEIDSFILNPSIDVIKNIVREIKDSDLFDSTLTEEIISKNTSRVAKIEVLREVLSKFQRDWVKKRKTVVVEGRDLGTTIFPDADVKLFLTADAKVRAERRTKQLQEKGDKVEFSSVYNQLVLRDKQDQSRKIAPLKKADDAIVLDTTHLDIEEMHKKAVELIERHLTL